MVLHLKAKSSPWAQSIIKAAVRNLCEEISRLLHYFLLHLNGSNLVSGWRSLLYCGFVITGVSKELPSIVHVQWQTTVWSFGTTLIYPRLREGHFANLVIKIIQVLNVYNS